MRAAVKYSPEEQAFLRKHKALSWAELHAEFVKKWHRPDVTVRNIRALFKRNGWKTGKTGIRFAKGNTPANKGRRFGGPRRKQCALANI